jgi:hypothetical protein
MAIIATSQTERVESYIKHSRRERASRNIRIHQHRIRASRERPKLILPNRKLPIKCCFSYQFSHKFQLGMPSATYCV